MKVFALDMSRTGKYCAPILASLVLVGVVLALAAGYDPASAQGAHHPFAVGVNEGAVGRVSGLGAWIIAQESMFYRHMTGAVQAIRQDGVAMWGLAGLSFAYGVFHAAGPGHGKAVITSYMVSNERALYRGLALALAAALLQGLFAILLVTGIAAVFGQLAGHLATIGNWLEIASYSGIVLLGLYLLWVKGGAFFAAVRLARAPAWPMVDLAFAAADRDVDASTRQKFVADDGAGHVHSYGCCGVAVDPRELEANVVDWRSAGLTVLTAAARPCSGAILVLVFAMAQGLFMAGVGAVFAMSLGTALTTGALASFAVFAKRMAVTIAGIGSSRAVLLGRAIEVGAALCVLAFGLSLLIASVMLGGLSGLSR